MVSVPPCTGDNLILGGYDKRVCWFDLDLSSKPYRVIRYEYTCRLTNCVWCVFIHRQHKQAVRGVCYHPRYPLFASCSDDGCITICHGMVYE